MVVGSQSLVLARGYHLRKLEVFLSELVDVWLFSVRGMFSVGRQRLTLLMYKSFELHVVNRSKDTLISLF